MKFTDKEKEDLISQELTRIFPQLKINAAKTCGMGTERWADDLLQLSVEMFLKKPLAYKWKVFEDQKMENFITFVMNFQLKSSSSAFWHTHRKNLYNSRELLPDYEYSTVHRNTAFQDEKSEVSLCLKKAIDKLNPYHKMIVDEIMTKGNKFNHVANKYDINYYHLKQDYNIIKIKLKKACKDLK